MLDFSVRVFPLDLNNEQLALRHKFVLQLIRLPSNINYFDLKPIIKSTDAKATHYSWTPDLSYRIKNFIYLFFESADKLSKVRD